MAMIDREKVIKGLGEILVYCHEQFGENDHDVQAQLTRMNQTAKDAIELLKAQEPRVLTLEEIEHEAGPMWYEERNGLTTWALCTNATVGDALEVTSFEFFENYDNSYLREYADTYNVCWRVWNAKPTDKQREEVKWNG